MARTPETTIKAWATREIKRLGGFSLPIPGGQFGVNGAPDRVVVWRGKVWFVEFKAGANKLGRSQEKIKALIEAAGGTYVVVRQPDDLYEALGLGVAGGKMFNLEVK